MALFDESRSHKPNKETSRGQLALVREDADYDYRR
jgi:hypothetical protein